MVYDYSRTVGKSRKGQAIKVTFAGGKPVQAQGIVPQPISTEFIAHRNSKPVQAKSFASTIARGVYPGIDVRTYVDNNRPRFDFLVGPGADASTIKMRYEGASSVAIRNNEVVLGTQIGDLKNGSLKAYQLVNGRQVTVPAYFAMVAKSEVAIHVGQYDHSKALVVDPLVYGSYYGGDDGFDEVRAVCSDSAGGTYLTGSTQASQFPSTYGPFLSLVGGTDAFLTKFQGDAYNHDFACYLGGSLDEYGAYLQVDAFNNVWVAGRTLSTDFPGNTRPNIMFLSQTDGEPATGGSFIMKYQNDQAVVAWNASPATVFAALNALPSLAGHVVSVTALQGGLIPVDTYRIELDGTRPLPLSIISNRVVRAGNEVSQGLPAIIIAAQTNPVSPSQTLTRRGSVPEFNAFVQGTFRLSFDSGGGNVQTTGSIAGIATAAQVQSALVNLSNIGTTNNIANVSCSGGPLSSATPITVTFQNALNSPQATLIVNNASMQPVPVYGIQKFSDIFLMRFSPDPTTTLAPQETMMFGGEGDESLSGFAIVPDVNPQPGDPVDLVFAGDIANDAGTDLTGAFPGGTPGYLARYRYSQGTPGSFAKIGTSSFYVKPGPGAKIDITGVALDSVGSAYIAGTVRFLGNSDTSQGANPPFATTAGVFPGGRFLKNDDIFVRKYSADGLTTMYSCVIGGNNKDNAGGTTTDISGNRVETGSCVAVDNQGNAYVTGVSTSFNFPRTRGVYGEVFDNQANVTVTKLNPDASSIVYSTNLKTLHGVQPAGIAVDTRGFAFISGNTQFSLLFPNPPGDPNEPQTWTQPTIQTTGDAIDPTYDSPVPNELPTVEPWLNVLNETATTLVYGTYLGGFLDDKVYAPYVDRFGDVWVMGWTDSVRSYFRASSAGALTNYLSLGQLPDAMISELAFKRFGDAAGLTEVDGVMYGILEGPGVGPATIDVGPPLFGYGYQRDGFVIKLRVGAAAISGLTFNPTTIAGGLGATTTGTVTLSNVAPPGGADVQLDLTDTAAGSFSSDPNNPIASEVVTVPEGTTSVDFTFYTYPVATNTQVQCKATYQGSFKIAQITVVPWLQTIALTPTSIVGGNSVTGRVTLSQAAPAGGVTVDLLTDSANLIVLPPNAQVTVPAGQTSVVFTIGTHGVVPPTNTLVTASLLGAGQSQTLTLTQAKLVSVSFAPPHVAGGSVSIGTVQLDGEAGAPFNVSLTLNAGTAGYSITTSNGTVVAPGSATLTVAQGARSANFSVNTVFETSSTNRKVTATRAAAGGYLLSSVQGTLFIDAVSLSNMTLNPNPVVGGLNSTGTVQLNTPAPAGGARVFLQSLNTAIATVPAVGYVDVPAGSSSATFQVVTFAQPADATVTIRANRGGTSPNIDRVLSVQTQRFTLTVSPTTVVGGLASSQGTITLNAPPPGGGLLINLSSTDAAAQVPATVTATGLVTHFTITTSTVTSTHTATIKGRVGPVGSTNTSQAILTIKPLGVVSIVLTPSSLRGGNSFSAKVTLDNAIGNAPMTVQLNYGSKGNQVIANPSDRTLIIPANSNTGTKSGIFTLHVSRTLSTAISVTLNGKTVSATLTVTP